MITWTSSSTQLFRAVPPGEARTPRPNEPNDPGWGGWLYRYSTAALPSAVRRWRVVQMRGYLEALRDGVSPPSADNFELLHGETLRVSVCSTGESIPEQDLPHIFDRFFRVDLSRPRELGGGAGIGLAIVREIVEAHGGSGGASSTAIETCVWFTLPLKIVVHPPLSELCPGMRPS